MIVALLALGGFFVWHGRRRGPVARVLPPAAALAPVAPAAVTAETVEDEAITRYLNQSLLLLGTTTAGALVAPVLTLLSVPFLLYQTYPVFQAAYDELTRRGKVGGACIRALTAAGLLAAGAFWVSALSAVMFA
ncbi:MAG: hypothetical protein AB7N90_14655, partial [Vicinamibacterales bacterium]